MTMYSESIPSADSVAKHSKWRATLGGQTTVFEKLDKWRTRFAYFGAMSIFCLPAILDVVLLTFLGRGMFMTAFMHPEHLRAAVYALLISLLLSAGIVGWVGSTGNYYLAHYAYDNMVIFMSSAFPAASSWPSPWLPAASSSSLLFNQSP